MLESREIPGIGAFDDDRRLCRALQIGGVNTAFIPARRQPDDGARPGTGEGALQLGAVRDVHLRRRGSQLCGGDGGQRSRQREDNESFHGCGCGGATKTFCDFIVLACGDQGLTSDYAAKHPILEIMFLNDVLDDVTFVPARASDTRTHKKSG